MGRCRNVTHYVILWWILLFLRLAIDVESICDDTYNDALGNFYEGPDEYSCDDLQYIQHGIGCSKKCKSIKGFMKYICNSNKYLPRCAKYSRRRRRRRAIEQECETHQTPCMPYAEYRSIDGSCNNLYDPLWGKSDRVQNRVLPNIYEDGRDSPRKIGCSGELPSARAISNIVHEAGNSIAFESRLSYMMMQVGQFLAHDMVLTKLLQRSDGEPLACCGEDMDNVDCNPINIPSDDPYFKPGGCMNFIRSLARRDCAEIRQQVNSQTSYIDLSMLYGSNLKESEELRLFSGGHLDSIDTKLPIDNTDQSCELSRPAHETKYYCTRSGDERVNEQPGLTSIHTILLREHNRLADGLASVNPQWEDERIYQEARKINIAQFQNIIFTEYLPLLLGPYTMRKYNLNVRRSGYRDTYNPYVDATITNSFAASVFRYGHSLVHRKISLVGYDLREITSQPLEKVFFEPHLYHSENNNGLEHILMWITSSKCPFGDRQMEKSVQTLLFQDAVLDSFDLAALNIQRGRDHGQPGYNAFRGYCSLSHVSHFGTGAGGLVDHDPNVADLLSQAYTCSDDIDLFTGFLSERRSPGSLLGPTGQCIAARQFKRLRDGDRFFFERRDTHTPWIGFKEAQLNEIKRIRLSTLLCMNTSASQLQRNVFLQSDMVGIGRTSNRMESCYTRRGINLSYWRSRF